MKYRQYTDRQNPALKEDIMRELNLSAPIAELFILRGFDSVPEIRAFMNAGSNELYSPMLFSHMAEAVAQIKAHIAVGNTITVYGDYDADGVCAVTVLYSTLKRIGANADYYIPNRQDEGYGLNRDAIARLAADGTRLIITVDCGIASHDEIEYAQSLGMDVVVTDHHEPQGVLDICPVINPKVEGENYPYSGLCGTAVASKLAAALEGGELNDSALQLATVATVADVMPLTDENRTIVSRGLRSFRRYRQTGLFALAEAADIDLSTATAESVAFGIVPRLNAAGRMGDASVCVELLTETDRQRAAETAQRLNKLNTERQALCSRIYGEAEQMLEGKKLDNVIVLQAPDWQHSVIGIVAARICERYRRPTVLLDECGGMAIGSGRSIEGFSLFSALTYAKDCLTRFGGHDGAAGLTLEASRTDELRALLNEYFDKNHTADILAPTVYYDMAVKADALTLELAEQLAVFEPTGQGNPEPTFLLNGVEVQNTDFIGKTKDHVRFRVGRNGRLEVLAWGAAPTVREADGFPAMDAVVTVSVNTYHGRRSLKTFAKSFTPLWYGALRYPARKRMYTELLDVAYRQNGVAFTDAEEWLTALKASLKSDRRTVVTAYTQAGLDAVAKLKLPTYFGAADDPNESCVVIAPKKSALDGSEVFGADGIMPDCDSATVARPSRAVMDELMAKRFDREYMASVYRCVKTMATYCTVDGVVSAMGADVNCFEVLAALKVFSDLGLLQITADEEVKLLDSGTKALTDSILFNKLNEMR